MARQNAPTVITLLDDVEKCEKEVVESLLALPDKKQIKIVINSGGGSVYASLGIATVIRMKRLQAEAVVLADCSSSAILVFAACQTRHVAPHASFLFHPTKWSSEDQARLHTAEAWSDEFRRICQVTEDWMVENLPISRRTLRNWIRKERYVSAHELFDLGIAEPLDLSEEGVIQINSRRGKKTQRRKTSARIRKVG